MANTFVALTKTVLTTSQATITMSSIVGTYSDLYLIMSVRSDNADNYQTLKLKFNDSTTGYSYTVADGYNSSTSSSRGSSEAFGRAGWINGTSGTASTFTSAEIYIPNYAGNKYKQYAVTSIAPKDATTGWDNAMFAAVWGDTAAITKIEIFPTAGSFVSGSRIDLYGIKNS